MSQVSQLSEKVAEEVQHRQIRPETSQADSNSLQQRVPKGHTSPAPPTALTVNLKNDNKWVDIPLTIVILNQNFAGNNELNRAEYDVSECETSLK